MRPGPARVRPPRQARLGRLGSGLRWQRAAGRVAPVGLLLAAEDLAQGDHLVVQLIQRLHVESQQPALSTTRRRRREGGRGARSRVGGGAGRGVRASRVGGLSRSASRQVCAVCLALLPVHQRSPSSTTRDTDTPRLRPPAVQVGMDLGFRRVLIQVLHRLLRLQRDPAQPAVPACVARRRAGVRRGSVEEGWGAGV